MLWGRADANRLIRTRSRVPCVEMQSDEAFRSILEIIIQPSLVSGCIFYQSQSSSRDQEEDCLFLLFPVALWYTYCLFYFLLLRPNSFPLMNCGQCKLNQEGNELFNRFLLLVASLTFAVFTIGVYLGDHHVRGRTGHHWPGLFWNNTKEKRRTGVWRWIIPGFEVVWSVSFVLFLNSQDFRFISCFKRLTDGGLVSLSHFKHSFFHLCMRRISKNRQLTFQTCLGVAALSITVNIKFALISLHYPCGVMQLKRQMIRFETSALHYLILIMWLWLGIRTDLMLTVMDYTP